MKNISRRVFIKGMAVAAVATAASTVLTGCKLPGVVEEGTETVVTPANTYTYTNKTKSLTIKAPKCVSSSVGASAADKVNIAIPVDVTNNMGNDVIFTDNLATDASSVAATTAAYVEVSVKGLTEDGLTISSLALNSDEVTGSTLENIFETGNKTFAHNNTASRMLSLVDVPEDWSKITVTLKVYEVIQTGTVYDIDPALESGKVEFTYNK